MTETKKTIEIVPLNMDNKTYYSPELGIVFIQERTETDLNIDQLTADAAYIKNALLGVEDIIEFRFSDEKVSLEDTNKLNGLLTAIGCLAKKHEKDLIEFGEKAITLNKK